MNTVESAFVLVDRASGPSQKIRRNLRDVRMEAEAAGRAIDDMAGPKAASDLQAFARTVHDARTEARDGNRDFRLMAGGVSTARREVDRMRVSTDRLVTSLRTLGAIDARPNVSLDGISEARAELAMLRRELREFGRMNVSGRAGIGGLGGGGGGGRAPRTAAYAGVPGGLGVVTTRTGMLAAGAFAALPMVQALTGAAGALAGTLTGAGLGVGAVGLAGGGALVAGVGALASVIAPMKDQLEDAAKAQQKYNEVVADYGRRSTEAARARREFNQALAAAPAGTRQFLGERSGLASDWRAATRGSQSDLLGLASGSMSRFRRRALPGVARNVRGVTRATRTQGLNAADFLTAPAQLHTMTVLTGTFARNLDEAEQIGEHLITTFGHIAEAASPLVDDGMDFVEKWTQGWADGTKDIASTRREIEGFVDDLESVAHLGGAGFDLIRDLIMPGRPAGRSLLDDTTDQLREWDRWAQRNPGKLQEFFGDAVDDTEKIAGALGDGAKALNDMATDLRPLIGPLTRLVSLASGLASVGPGVLGTAFLGYRGLRSNAVNGGGLGAGFTGGGAAGVAGAPMVLGGGAGAAGLRGGLSRGSALRLRAMRLSPNAITRATAADLLSAGGASSNSALLARGGGAALRFALPALALGAASGVFGEEGANELDNRGFGLSAVGTVHNALQGAGAAFGLAHPVLGTSQRVSQGQAQATQFLSGLPGGQTPTSKDINQQRYRIRGELNRVNSQIAAGGISRNDLAEMQARLATLHQQYAALGDLRKQAEQLTRQRLNEESRDHGRDLIDSFGKAFDTYDKQFGPSAAMDKVVHGVFTKMRGMREPGAKILGENTLRWAQEQARDNPALAAQVDWLEDHIKRSFSRTGKHVQIVNGQILTGSRREWGHIADALIAPAERAKQEVTANFTAIQQQAVGSLVAMGYTKSQAQGIVSGLERGGVSGARASIDASQGPTGAGQRPSVSDANMVAAHRPAKTGDGPGNATMGGVATAATSAGLMGANPNLEPYADAGRGFGLTVTSGARPGAITVSGNTSYHSSGHAIDMSGPPDAMMKFARFMASHYGGSLEELIYTPMGAGIKNGVPYTYTGAVAADHYDHVHVADVDPRAGRRGGVVLPGGGGMVGGQMLRVNLRAPGSRLGGVAGALSSRASSAYAQGLQQKLNQALGGGAGGGFAGGIPGNVQSYNHRFPPGVTLTPAEVAMIASSVGLPGTTFAQIAHGESGYQPGITQPDPGDGMIGYGLFQNTPNSWGQGSAAWNYMMSLGGIPAMYNPVKNAMMAKFLYDSAGHSIRPWYGTRYVTGTGDGLGMPRVRFGGGGSPIIRRTGDGTGRGGGSVVHAPVHISGTGVGTDHVSAIVQRHLARFVADVEAEINSGRAESDMELIA